MLIYLIPSFCWFAFSFYWGAKRVTPDNYLSLLFFSPLMFIAVFRGNVGTDTWTYYSEIKRIVQQSDRIYGQFEPGYELFIRLLSFITIDPRIILILLTILNVLLFFIVINKWSSSLATNAAIIVPFYFFDFTMNGLRIGLAFPLALLACTALKRNRTIIFILLSVLAVSIQMTAGLLILLLLIQQERFLIFIKSISIKYTIKIACSILIFVVFIYNFLSLRIFEKFELYASETSATELTGAGPLLLSIILFVLSVTLLRSESNRLKLMIFYVIIQVGFYQLTKVSYAGTRLQVMALFAQSLYFKLPENCFQIPIKAFALCMLFGICIYWRLQTFTREIGGDSPFLPYHYIWELSSNLFNIYIQHYFV